MKLKLGSLEFDATPHNPRYEDVPLYKLGTHNRHYLANLDYRLLRKEARTVYTWDCKSETRHDLGPQDRLRIETDLTLFVPQKDPSAFKGSPPINDPKKARAMAYALANACGFADPDALNKELQATLASFTEKAPIATYKAELHPHRGFVIYADITYEHLRLKVPGKRLNGFVFLSLPIAVKFEVTTTGRCPGFEKKKWVEPSKDRIRPLIGNSLTALAFAKAAFKRFEADAEYEVKRLEKLERETLAEEPDESLSKKKQEKAQKGKEYIAEIYREAAEEKKKDLKTMQDALKARTEAMGKD